MRHRIEAGGRVEPGADAAAMAAAIEGCVHCGFCLPACPTYAALGEEMDSPRGRIVLMKEALEGGVGFEAARPHLDRCLGCLACEPACPSGVRYHELLHPFRDLDRRRRPWLERLRRRTIHRLLASPRLLRTALTVVRPLAGMLRRLPAPLGPAAALAAEADASASGERSARPEVVETTPPRGRVLLLAGCAQEALRPGITDAAVRVLARFGIEARLPSRQGCCGSLALHDGDLELARSFARRNLDVFGDGAEPVVTTAAGCGSGMHEYPLLFAGTADAERAERLARRTVDVSVLLAGLEPPACPAAEPGGRRLRVAYQGACHLEQAQGVRAEPRSLLRRLPGVELVDLGDGDRCCGSAGTYNLEQPEIAAQLGAAKAAAVGSADVDLVATGNIGCLVQMRVALAATGREVPILHTVEILDRALAGRPLI